MTKHRTHVWLRDSIEISDYGTNGVQVVVWFKCRHFRCDLRRSKQSRVRGLGREKVNA